MDQSLEQQVHQRMAELPAEVQAAIASSDLGAKVHAIGTKNQLHIDQSAALETQVYLAMLGFSPLEELAKDLEKGLILAPEAAQKIAAEVNTDIFGSIREAMKKFAEQKATQPKVEEKPQPAPEPPQTPPPAAQKPPPNPALQPADVVLTEKTVSLAPPTPKLEEKPIYKADPYREPV